MGFNDRPASFLVVKAKATVLSSAAATHSVPEHGWPVILLSPAPRTRPRRGGDGLAGRRRAYPDGTDSPHGLGGGLKHNLVWRFQ